MYFTLRTTILAAAACLAVAAPALAESTSCVVTAQELRLRKGPSMKAKVIGILKKDERATTVGKCSGGWVKVTSKDGRRTGYVGGWALASQAAKTADTAAAPAASVAQPDPPAAPAPLGVQLASTDSAIPVTAPVKENPNNEQLAIQITQLRLKVLGLGMDVDKMKKDIQRIKTAIKKGNGRNHKASKKS